MTVAVLLHQAQKDPDCIKIPLRWVSNAFKEYLCNTETIMKQHVKALCPDSLLIQLGILSQIICQQRWHMALKKILLSYSLTKMKINLISLLITFFDYNYL